MLRRPGAARLRAVLGSSPAHTRSKAEERFLALVGRGQLARPEVNVKVCGYEVDFFWRKERLVTEVDGFAYHSSSNHFETDRRRDADLSAAGIRVLRITWRQLVREPEAILVRLALALGRTAAF
jgi:very-short-patch-repair endonuclease